MDPQTVELHYHQFGSGPPIVILHGLFGSSRNWQSVARNLANNFLVVTVDLRNHGTSPHATQMGYAAMAQDVSRLLQKLDLAEVTLIGHSMGGKVAMTLALTNPDRISQLVIVDIGPEAYENDYNDLLGAMSGLDLDQITRRSDAQIQLKAAIPNNEIRSFILQNLSFNGAASPHWRINLPAIREAIDNIVDAIPIPSDSAVPFNAPAHFIRGENSDRIGERSSSPISRLFPNWDLVTIANAGHWPHAENPVEFLTKLRQLLDR